MKKQRIEKRLNLHPVYAVISALVLFCIIFTSQAALALVEYCDIYVGKEKVFSVTNTQLLSAIDRGEQINERLRKIVADRSIQPSELTIRTGIDRVPVICVEDQVICGITQLDAYEAKKTQQTLATEWKEKLQKHIAETRAEPASEKSGGTSESKATGEQHGGKTLTEHNVLLLFVELSLLLLASLICGEIMVRLGQPAIIGQILAGLLLGPTFFGYFFPDISSQLFPRDGSQSRLIEVISWIGVSFILMLTGMETDTAMLKRLGKPAVAFGLIGLVGPLIAGAAISLLMPDRLMGDSPNKVAFAIYMGTIFAASSVPVVARILSDMKMLKFDVGQLIIATSLAHDLLCCLLLAVIVVCSGTSEGGNPVALATFGTIAFLALLYFGRPLFFAGLRWVNDHVSSSDGLITAMIVLLLAAAATTQTIGVHIVLGAFAAGVILSNAPVINHKVIRPLEIVTMGFFAPVFFASSGLNVSLNTLLEPGLGAIAVALAVGTILFKLGTCLLAGKVSGRGTWESLSIGVGANAKGSLGLILAMLGFSLNIISLDMYAVVIFIALFSTGITAPLMKLTMSKVTVSDDERARMQREERKSRTMLNTIRRVLWPTSGRGRNAFIAFFLNSIGQSRVIETTALWVQRDKTKVDRPFEHIATLIDRSHVGVLEKSIESTDPVAVISEEANKGYDLIVMATDEPPGDANYVFGHLVDNVILNTSTRVLVVYEPDPTVERTIRKVLVPVSGSELSISAAEFGISLAKSLNAKAICLSIADSEATDLYGDTTRSGQKIQQDISAEIESTLSELSNALDVEFESILIQTSSHTAQAAILSAQQNDIDLIVLGAEPKLGKGLFFGHTINYILRNAPCAIAVLKMRG